LESCLVLHGSFRQHRIHPGSRQPRRCGGDSGAPSRSTTLACTPAARTSSPPPDRPRRR
jgi:hypothetical protein